MFQKIKYLTYILLCFFLITSCGAKKKDVVVSGSRTESCPLQTEQPKKQDKTIYVYACGAVRHPGVYQLKEQDRICHLLKKAGGFSKEASRNAVNLAQILTDGQKIHFPKKERKADRTQSLSDPSAETSGKIDLNQAGKEQLMGLTGIGATRASAIIEYRKKNGRFHNIEDITRVPGIKEGTYNKFKSQIVVN